MKSRILHIRQKQFEDAVIFYHLWQSAWKWCWMRGTNKYQGLSNYPHWNGRYFCLEKITWSSVILVCGNGFIMQLNFLELEWHSFGLLYNFSFSFLMRWWGVTVYIFLDWEDWHSFGLLLCYFSFSFFYEEVGCYSKHLFRLGVLTLFWAPVLFFF